ncbi:hypothetical protein DFP72DRAFT_839188 [Ephemerocybe angulata]|uniref:Uncharacterized protein n=1 Tax=Ephemerocybe angulata TaxID=980116 RepID=A0A8H6MGA1_9AGAR|nr:hypothetical protein DFP72DRAFT_839188 [Tulosesus angulatus]
MSTRHRSPRTGFTDSGMNVMLDRSIVHPTQTVVELGLWIEGSGFTGRYCRIWGVERPATAGAVLIRGDDLGLIDSVLSNGTRRGEGESAKNAPRAVSPSGVRRVDRPSKMTFATGGGSNSSGSRGGGPQSATYLQESSFRSTGAYRSYAHIRLQFAVDYSYEHAPRHLKPSLAPSIQEVPPFSELYPSIVECYHQPKYDVETAMTGSSTMRQGISVSAPGR